MLAVWAGFAIGITHPSSYGAEAEEAAAPAEAAPAEGGEEAAPGEPKQTKSYFMYVVESSGFIGFVILCLSIYFVATVAQDVLRASRADRDAAGDARRMRTAAPGAEFQRALRVGAGRRLFPQPRA